MSILTQDIDRYTGYMEFAYDGLVRCHPNDEARLRTIYNKYKNVIECLNSLEETLNNKEN